MLLKLWTFISFQLFPSLSEDNLTAQDKGFQFFVLVCFLVVDNDCGLFFLPLAFQYVHVTTARNSKNFNFICTKRAAPSFSFGLVKYFPLHQNNQERLLPNLTWRTVIQCSIKPVVSLVQNDNGVFPLFCRQQVINYILHYSVMIYLPQLHLNEPCVEMLYLLVNMCINNVGINILFNNDQCFVSSSTEPLIKVKSSHRLWPVPALPHVALCLSWSPHLIFVFFIGG